jgi:hypothetical protein
VKRSRRRQRRSGKAGGGSAAAAKPGGDERLFDVVMERGRAPGQRDAIAYASSIMPSRASRSDPSGA